MKNKWQALLKQIEVIDNGYPRVIWTPEDIAIFEQEKGFILPEEYKNFLEVFGVGSICKYIYFDYSQYKFYNDVYAKPHKDVFYFGYIVQSHLIYWDLTTYSDVDKSYDIYVIERDWDDYDRVPYKVTRNFYYFVRDFCLGAQYYKVCSADYDLVEPQMFIHVFQPSTTTTSEDWPLIHLRDEQKREEQNKKPSIENYLKLPHGLEYKKNRDTEEWNRQYPEKEEAIEENKPYAYFRYLKTLRNHSAPIYAVKFTPDNQMLVTASEDKTIKIWHRTTYQEICTLTGHSQAVLCLAISPNSHILASGSADHTIKLWHLQTGQEIATLTGHNKSVLSLAISPNSHILASSSADHTIKLWNIQTGQLLHTLTDHRKSVLCLGISTDGRILASGSADRTTKLWNLSTGELIHSFQKEGMVFSVDFHPSKPILVTASSNRTLKVWDLATFELIRSIDTGDVVTSVVISPDGEHFASAEMFTIPDVGSVRELETGKYRTSFLNEYNDLDSLIDHSDTVYSIQFSPDGAIIATGSRDNTIKLWGIPKSLAKIE